LQADDGNELPLLPGRTRRRAQGHRTARGSAGGQRVLGEVLGIEVLEETEGSRAGHALGVALGCLEEREHRVEVTVGSLASHPARERGSAPRRLEP